MALGSKNGSTSTGADNGEKPVIFQQYFKNGNRTYASQVKVSQIGKKYLVLTEGHRDPKTQELRKHTICVFEQDLKQFFAILQETVLYLRSAKDSSGTMAGAAGMPVEAKSSGNVTARPAKPPIAARSSSATTGNTAKVKVGPQKLPNPTRAATPPKPAMRPGMARPSAAPAPATKVGHRTGNRATSR